MLPGERQEADLQRFLRRVDELADLLEGVKSADPVVQEKALAEAEERLRDSEASPEEECRTKVNKTVINTRAPDVRNVETVSSDGFLAALEKDARERAKQRKRNERLANALKEKGNDSFRRGDYVTAIQKYTEGLEKLKDHQQLYTNRAQAYLKMQEYEKAIDDCSWALKCNEKCVKAYFLMGKAHLALKHFTESRQCYQKILDIDPQKKSLFKDCINEVNLEEKRMSEEERALKEFQSGKFTALSIKELLQKLDKPDQNILYYSGGIRVLTGAMKDCTEQTLFRTNDGFRIINDNEVIRRGFCAESKNTTEVDLSISLLFLWQAVCAGNEENQRLLLTHPDMNVQLLKLLSSGVPEIQKETLALISLYSETEYGRRLLVRHQDLSRWLQILMMFINSPDGRASSAVNILADLTKEESFKIQCRIEFSTAVLPLFSRLLISAKRVNGTALAHCIGIMGDLCTDGVLQKKMAECPECWQACVKLVDECLPGGTAPEYQECLFAVLGLMMNLLLESSAAIQCFALDISGRCMSLLSSKDGRIVTVSGYWQTKKDVLADQNRILQRALGVLSRILPTSSSAVEEVVKGGIVKKMIKILKAGGQITSNYAIRTLSVCTKSNSQAQEEVVKSDKRFGVLLKLLNSENEIIVGNAAFCLGRCLVVPGAAASLLNSNVVMVLLKHAGGDAANTSVQENAAIALGRLCIAEPRHIFQLRQLNGMAILNSSMKLFLVGGAEQIIGCCLSEAVIKEANTVPMQNKHCKCPLPKDINDSLVSCCLSENTLIGLTRELLHKMQEKIPILILIAAELLDLSDASRNDHHGSEDLDQKLPREVQQRAESSAVTSEVFSLTEDNLDEVTFDFQTPAVDSTNEMTARFIPVQTEMAAKLTGVVPSGLVRQLGWAYQMHKEEEEALKHQDGGTVSSRLLGSTSIPILRHGSQPTTHEEQPNKSLTGKPERGNVTESNNRLASSGGGVPQPVQDSLDFAAVFSKPAIKQTEMPSPKLSLLPSTANFHTARKEIAVKMALESARMGLLPTLTPSANNKRPKDTNPEAQPDSQAHATRASTVGIFFRDAGVTTSAFIEKPTSGNLEAIYSRMMHSTAVQFSPTVPLKEEKTATKTKPSKAPEMKSPKPPSQLPAHQALPQVSEHSSLSMPLETLLHDDLIQSSFQGPRSTTDRSQSLSFYQTLNCTNHISQETTRSSQGGVLLLQGDAKTQAITSKPKTDGSPRGPQTSANSSPLSQSQMSELKFSPTAGEQGVTPAFPHTSTFGNAGFQLLSTLDSVRARHQPLVTAAAVYAGLHLRGISTSAKKGFHIPISSTFTSPGSQVQAISAHPRFQETFPIKPQRSTVKDSEGKTGVSSQVDKAGSLTRNLQASTTPSLSGFYENGNPKVLHSFAPPASQTQRPGSLESFPPRLALLHTQGRQPSSATGHPEPVVPSGSHEILSHVAQALVQHFGVLRDAAAKNLSGFRVDQFTVLPSSQYLSFLLRNTDGEMCLQPMPNSPLPTGFPNISVGTLISIQQMLAAYNSSAVDFTNLQNLGFSSLLLLKPVFILLPAEGPGFQTLYSPNSEDNHKTALSFTSKQDLNLIPSERSHTVPTKTSSYSISQPLRPETLLSTASKQSAEKMQATSRTVPTNANSTATSSSFQAVTSASNRSLYLQTRMAAVQAIHLHSLPEEVQLSAPFSEERQEPDMLLLNGAFAEPLTSAVLPLASSTKHSSSVSPKVFFTAEKPSYSLTSFLSAKRLLASETPAHDLFTRRRVVDQVQHSMKLRLPTTNLHQGKVTTSSSVSTQCTECLTLHSAGIIKHRGQMSTNIMPLQSSSQTVSSMASLQRLPAHVEFVPNTLPPLSPGNSCKNSTAGSNACSGGVTAPATAVRTSTLSVKPHLVPKAFMVTERPPAAPVYDPFSTKVQMKTTTFGKLLATATHTRIYAKSPARLPSSVLTDAPLLPTAKQSSLAPTKLFSLPDVGENAKPTEVSTSIGKIGTSTFLGTSMSVPAVFNARTQQPPTAVLGNKTALTLVQPSVPARSIAFEREPKLTSSTLPSPSVVTFLSAAKNDHMPASLTNKKAFLLPTSAIKSDPYVALPTVARMKATVVSPSTVQNDGMLVKEEYAAATGQLPVRTPVISSRHASASLRLHPLENILLEDNTEQEPGLDAARHSTRSSTTKSVSVSASRLVNKGIYLSPVLNSADVDDPQMLLTPDLSQILPTPESLSYSSQILVPLASDGNSLPNVMSSGHSEKPFLNTEAEELFKTNEVTEEAAEGLVTVLTLLDSEPNLVLSESRQRSALQPDEDLLNGHAVVTDVCGSGNYTALMSLRPAAEASSEVYGSLPPQETFLALVALQSNSSHAVLRIRSCCVTPTSRVEGPDAACCLFHRLPSECRHIQLLQTGQSRAASFTIQLFQMLNHSVAYLHCELNVCLHGKTGCEQDCFEGVEMLPAQRESNSYGNLQNLISFGPVLRMKNKFLYKPVQGPDSAMLVPVLLGSLTGFAVLSGAFLSLWLHHRRNTKNLGYPPLGEVQSL